MTVTDAFAYAIAGLLTIQAVLRVKSALNGRRRERSLWGAFAALAVSWLCRTSAVNNLLDATGTPDLGFLVKHATAIIGICVLLRYVTAVYADADADVRRSARISAVVHRIAARASVGTIAVMTTAFFFLLDPPDTSTLFFLERHEGDLGLPIYMGLFYLYMGAAAAVCAVQWGGAARTTPVRSVRIGMLLMSSAMVLAVLYVLLRTAFVVTITVTTVSDSTSQTQEALTDSLLYLFSLLWGIGAIAPVSRAASERYRAVRNLLSLHWLWKELAMAAPDVVRHRPSRLFARLPLVGQALDTFRDVFASPDASLLVRLNRYTVDIRDVIFELRRRAPADLVERARDHAQSVPDDLHGTEIRAEALWIRSALLCEGPATPDKPAPLPEFRSW
ncbi:MAB_1171c family putative transporter [Streptomyces spongiicola]|uniref:MAB_1171c family putative transporter n=1 Tax=Streptomyces spongiicola TaxID=1690221 RepID=UPI0021CF8F98|nr:MAB_1171c family putative transporter [Streptomyces spongiicola]